MNTIGGYWSLAYTSWVQYSYPTNSHGLFMDRLKHGGRTQPTCAELGSPHSTKFIILNKVVM